MASGAAVCSENLQLDPSQSYNVPDDTKLQFMRRSPHCSISTVQYSTVQYSTLQQEKLDSAFILLQWTFFTYKGMILVVPQMRC